jgi:hypothetical protein
MNKLRRLVAEMRELMEMDSGNVGPYVRPLGPMLPPAPLPGYEDAADLLDPPKQKQLDSRPKKKRSR